MLADPEISVGPAARLDHLVRAFCRLAASRPHLEVGFHGTISPSRAVVDPERGIDIRLHCPETDATVLLRVARSGAVLRAFSTARPDSDMVSLIEDHLSMYLDRGYRWGATTFSSPDELAETLLDHMSRRLAALQDGGLQAHNRATAPAARPPWPRARRVRPGHAVRRVPEASTGRL